jgi:hypothetical protein
MRTEICYACKRERDGRWALIFSPPNEREECEKFHVCPDCFRIVISAVKA